MKIRAQFEWDLEIPDDVEDVEDYVEGLLEKSVEAFVDEVRFVDYETVQPWEDNAPQL